MTILVGLAFATLICLNLGPYYVDVVCYRFSVDIWLATAWTGLKYWANINVALFLHFYPEMIQNGPPYSDAYLYHFSVDQNRRGNG